MSILHRETAVVGMLKESDWNSIDMVLTFIGEIVNTCRGNSESSPVTAVFSLYVDIATPFYRRFCGKRWKQRELNNLAMNFESKRSKTIDIKHLKIIILEI